MNTLISTDLIKELVFQNPIRTMLEGNLNIYEEPNENELYIAGVDISKGVGRDSSTIQVIKVTKYPFVQVATYRCNTISPMLFIDVVEMVGKTYNDAYLVIENNADETFKVLKLEYEKYLKGNHEVSKNIDMSEYSCYSMGDQIVLLIS